MEYQKKPEDETERRVKPLSEALANPEDWLNAADFLKDCRTLDGDRPLGLNIRGEIVALDS